MGAGSMAWEQRSQLNFKKICTSVFSLSELGERIVKVFNPWVLSAH